MMDLASMIAEPARGSEAPAPFGPIARSHRGARMYQPGIGPHGENIGVALALASLGSRCDARLPDGAPRKR